MTEQCFKVSGYLTDMFTFAASLHKVAPVR